MHGEAKSLINGTKHTTSSHHRGQQPLGKTVTLFQT